MEDFMEQRLQSLHVSGSKSKFKMKFMNFIFSAVFVFILPFIHIGIFYRYWVPDKPVVNKARCACDCFDTVFRGRYEYPPSSYKHFYFNATSNSLWIWMIVVLGVLALYEVVRYVFTLAWEGRIRWSMVAVLTSALYPHYYGWWGLINYLNEDFYPQWYHQIIFSLTEAASTAMVVHLCNSRAPMTPSKLFFIIVINLQHIIVAGLDQFIKNIIYREGQGFEAVRDLALMMPDLLHVLFPFFELQNIAMKRRQPIVSLFYKEEYMLAGLVLILFTLLFKNI